MRSTELEMRDGGAALAAAEALRKDCEQLRLSLALLEREVDGGADVDCLRHLEKAGQLRERISQRTTALRQRQGRGKNVFAAENALRHQITQCQRLLAESGETCAKLAEKMHEVHAEVGRKLHEMRQGSRMLGSYKAHACVAGGTYSSGA